MSNWHRQFNAKNYFMNDEPKPLNSFGIDFENEHATLFEPISIDWYQYSGLNGIAFNCCVSFPDNKLKSNTTITKSEQYFNEFKMWRFLKCAPNLLFGFEKIINMAVLMSNLHENLTWEYQQNVGYLQNVSQLACYISCKFNPSISFEFKMKKQIENQLLLNI